MANAASFGSGARLSSEHFGVNKWYKMSKMMNANTNVAVPDKYSLRIVSLSLGIVALSGTNMLRRKQISIGPSVRSIIINLELDSR